MFCSQATSCWSSSLVCNNPLFQISKWAQVWSKPTESLSLTRRNENPTLSLLSSKELPWNPNSSHWPVTLLIFKLPSTSFPAPEFAINTHKKKSPAPPELLGAPQPSHLLWLPKTHSTPSSPTFIYGLPSLPHLASSRKRDDNYWRNTYWRARPFHFLHQYSFHPDSLADLAALVPTYMPS